MTLDCLDNRIDIMQGDKGYLNFRCGNYKLTKGDVVNFTVSAREEDRNLFQIQVAKFNDLGIASIILEEHHTTQPIGAYKYTLEVLTGTGIKESVLNGIINIVKNNKVNGII